MKIYGGVRYICGDDKLKPRGYEMIMRIYEGVNPVHDPHVLGQVIVWVMSGNSPQKRRAKLMKEKAIGASSNDLVEFVKALK